eukprot:gene3529-3798_t
MCSVLGKTATQAADMGLAAEDDPFDYICIIHKKQPMVNSVPAHHHTFEDASLTAADQDMLLYSDGACYGNCSSSSSCDSELQVDGGSSTQGSCSVFFARVPPTVPYESIKALFEQFGKVKLLNLFRPWATAKTSKGCGILEYEDPAAAVAGMEALHTKYHWTGGDTTMVVEWMDLTRHRKDKASPGPGGKSGTPKGSKTAKAVKGSCGRRSSGTPKANPFTVNPSGLSSGTFSLPHSFGSGYTLVAIPNSLSAHPQATRVRPLAAEAGDTAWLLHADLAAAEAAARGCLPQCGELAPAPPGSGSLGETRAGQLLGGGLAGRAAARSGRGVVALPGKAGILGAGNEDFATARGASLPSHGQATPLYASSGPTPLRLARHALSHWDLTPPPARGPPALPLCSADLASVSWQQDTSLLSSLADSCMASSLNSVCAHQQAGVLSHGLPGVAAMFPAAACDGNLSSELQAMQQLVDELNGHPGHGSVYGATAPGSGTVKPVNRLLHLSQGPDDLLRSRLAQASQVQQSFAGAPMAAVDALLLANKSSGSAGIPAMGTAALLPSCAQQQQQAPVAPAGIAGVLHSAQVPASNLHCISHTLTRPLGSVGSSLLGSGHGYLNVTDTELSSSPVHLMNPCAAIPAPTYGSAKPSCFQPSACLGSFSGVGSFDAGDLENSMREVTFYRPGEGAASQAWPKLPFIDQQWFNDRIGGAVAARAIDIAELFSWQQPQGLDSGTSELYSIAAVLPVPRLPA